jgi:hypothetical protein
VGWKMEELLDGDEYPVELLELEDDLLKKIKKRLPKVHRVNEKRYIP